MTRAGPRAPWVVLALAVLATLALRWPALDAGHVSDDLLQLSMLEGTYPAPRSPLDLYAFVDARRGDVARLVESGSFPWWTHPDLRLSALRPLSSALLALEHALGASAFAKHAHSVAWCLALVTLHFQLLRQRLSPTVAALGTVLFAVDPAHAIPGAWISNRAAVMGVTLGIAALLAQRRWRARGGLGPGALSTSLWALTLLTGEYGVCMAAYGVVEALLVAPAGRRRWLGLLQVGGPTLAYLTARGLLGYGAEGSSAYVDQRGGAWFALVAVIRWIALMGDELILFPAEPASHLAFLAPGSFLVLLVPLGVVSWLSIQAARRSTAEEGVALLALGVGALVAAIPVVAAVPATRLLLPASVGGSAVMGAVLLHAARRAVAKETGLPARLLLGAAALTLGAAHLGLAPLASYTQVRLWRDEHRQARARVVEGAFSDPRVLEAERVVLLSAPDAPSVLHPPLIARDAGRPPRGSWHVLCACTPGHVFRRTAADELTVSGTDGLVIGPAGWALRAVGAGFERGARIQTPALSVEVLDVLEGRAREVRFRLDRPLDDPSLALLLVTPRGLEHIVPPPLGGALTIPDARLNAAFVP